MACKSGRSIGGEPCICKADGADGALDDIKKKLASVKGLWCAVDPTFTIEIGFLFSLFGEAGGTLLGNLVLGALPTKASPCHPDDTLQRLQDIKKQRWFPYVPEVAMSLVFVLLEFLSDLVSRRCPRQWAS